VKVKCPIDATKDTQIPIILTGVSVRSQEAVIEDIVKTDKLIMIVGEINELQLKIEDSTKYVDPNGTVEYTLEITNLGNKDIIYVVLSIEGKQPGWTVKYPEEPQAVYQGQTRPVTIRVTAPGYVGANQKLVLNVIGVIKDATNFRASAPLTVIVNHVYDFDAVVIEKDGVRVDPGNNVWFRMQISNLGNGEDLIMPNAYEILLDWNLTFYNLEGYQKYEFTMDWKSSIFINGRIKVPEDTRTGQYVVGVNLTGEGSSKVVYVKVYVNQTYDLQVKTLDDTNVMTTQIQPDQEKPFVLQVGNYGNGLERVTLRLGKQYDPVRDQMEVLYDGWEGKFVAIANTPDFTTNIRPFDFTKEIPISNLVADVYYTPNFTAAAVSGSNIDEIREITLVLDKGQTAWVHLTLKAPRFEVQSSATTDISVSGRGEGGPNDWNETIIKLEVLFPDLVFVKDEKGKAIEFSGGSADSGFHATVGDVLTIIVKIKNVGDIPAENVDVQLKIDGEEKKVSTLRSVKNGDNETDEKTVIFSWVAEAGDHKVEVVLDPENTVVEAPGGEGDSNSVTRTVKVQGSFVVKELVNNNPIISTMLIILLAIVALVGAALLLKTSKRI
jgi:uncharacterized membrane protein